MKSRALLLLALVAATACSRRREAPARVPVVLISIDTLRADHLPFYGYGKVDTPALSALRRDSILYTNAVAHVPLTLPSHVTLMTGLLPPANGVRDNIGYRLPESADTLASRLKKNGYATGAAISSVVLTGSSGISSGFDDYDDNVESNEPGLGMGEVQRSGFWSEKIAEEWIRRHEAAPFFYFLHLYEPHTPYEPPEPFRSRYKESPYDGEIATADQIVGNFISFLKGEKVYDRALIVVLSDHGEGLGQHGEDEHGILLYRETLHVPLVIKLPGSSRGGESVSRAVGLIDVFPTIVEAVGIGSPAAGRSALPGISLLGSATASAAGENRRLYSETLYPRYHFGWSDLSGLTDSRYQYIHGPLDEIYDFRSDPAEEKDLAAALPPAFRSMRNQLLAMDRPRQAPGASDPEQVKKLASLGYLGSAAAPEDASRLLNPKDQIGDVRALKSAGALVNGGRYGEALVILRAIVRKNPSMVDAWAQIASVLHLTGRNAEAIEALREIDRQMPGSSLVFDSFATDYLEIGDFKQAELYGRRAVAASDTPATRTNLARVLLAKGDLDGAEAEARKALLGHEAQKLPRFVLALVAKRRGDALGALALLEGLETQSASAAEPSLINVQFQRGDILARLGRSPEAEAAFRLELSRFPTNLAAWRSLAVLLAGEGREEESRRVLAEMVRSSGNPRATQVARETLQLLTRGGS